MSRSCNKSRYKNTIRRFDQVLEHRKRAFSPLEVIKSQDLLNIANQSQVLSEDRKVNTTFDSHPSKMGVTSEYFSRIYKHGIPLRMYKTHHNIHYQ